MRCNFKYNKALVLNPGSGIMILTPTEGYSPLKNRKHVKSLVGYVAAVRRF